MIKVNVMYPYTEGARFDHAYYRDRHMPMVKARLGRVQIGEVTRDAGVDPASGLGLFVREANTLLRQIQSVVLNEQADEFIRVAAGCLLCGRRPRHQGQRVNQIVGGQIRLPDELSARSLVPTVSAPR